MQSRRIRLGELLELRVEKNDKIEYKINNLRGLSVNKEFIQTKAKMDGVSLKPYLIVEPDDFAYVTVTSRNSEKITIAYNASDRTYIVSSSYNVFRVKRKDLLSPRYLSLFFDRPEFDRYSRFNSWGSAREVFSWQELCDIEFELPDYKTQEEFLKIYSNLKLKLNSFNKALFDMKLISDGYIEDLRTKYPRKRLGSFIREKKVINSDYSVKRLYGLTNKLGFQKPSSMSDGSDLRRYKIVIKDDIVYPPPHLGEVGTIDIFKHNSGVVSPMYVVFEVVNKELLLPDYLIMWLKRKDFMRFAFFAACDSIRDTFDFSKMCDYEIPIPDISVQKSIVNIYRCYVDKIILNEDIKKLMKEISPVLYSASIKVSLGKENT